MRVFLTNYQRNAPGPVNLQQLDGNLITSTRGQFDDWAGVSSADLTAEELKPVRQCFHRYLAESANELKVVKLHDAYCENGDEYSLYTGINDSRVLYLVRNPLDVAVSYAHHDNISIAKTIKRLNCTDYVMASQKQRGSPQFPQPLGSWSHHTRSWTETSTLVTHVVRYEDMIEHPLETFTGVLDFIGLAVVTEQVEHAIASSQFRHLQALESSNGFFEKPPNVESFFRQGKIGDWRNALSTEQVKNIITVHGDMMRQFGYLTADGELTV